jgi:hypothetical protein
MTLFTDVRPTPAVQLSVPDLQTITDAYLYLLSRAFVVRQEQIDKAEPGFAYNQVKYNPLGSATFVNPNFDVCYLEAWIAVDDESAIVLDVPQIEGRYYTAQILDEWGEVIANINERTFPSKSYGRFVLVTPNSTIPTPPGAGRIVLHSSKVKLLARVELKGEPDVALALQKRFTVKALGNPVIAPPVGISHFNNEQMAGVDLFDAADALMGSALDVSPHAAGQQQQARAVAAYVASGPTARKAVADKLPGIVSEFITYAFTKCAPRRDHWTGGARTGNYGADYWLRASLNFGGLWANTWDEVIYFVATTDETDTPLNGDKNYVIHFPPDKLPATAVDGYWSVILVSAPDYHVVANPLNRYNFNSYSPLKFESDGSLKIAIGAEPVTGVPDSNRLPSPLGGAFSLTFRTYVPKDSVKSGEWSPPAVTKV